MSESEEERELPELPHDVIVDILSRLPCKSLVKFRCVSKQWNSLIRSHKFAKLQFSTVTDPGLDRWGADSEFRVIGVPNFFF
ncbi:unnamed protein product [Rhodiola kirilowii]